MPSASSQKIALTGLASWRGWQQLQAIDMLAVGAQLARRYSQMSLQTVQDKDAAMSQALTGLCTTCSPQLILSAETQTAIGTASAVPAMVSDFLRLGCLGCRGWKDAAHRKHPQAAAHATGSRR